MFEKPEISEAERAAMKAEFMAVYRRQPPEVKGLDRIRDTFVEMGFLKKTEGPIRWKMLHPEG